MTGTGPDGHDGAARRVRIQLRQEDLSPSGHVGNASIVRVLEEARTVFLGHARPGRVGYHEGLLEILGDEARMLVGQQTVEYTKELWYSHDPVVVTLWITHVGRSSFSVAATIAGQDTGDARPAVSSEATIVLMDRATRAPWSITDEARAVFARHRGEPVALRPRPAVAAAPRP
ncbi:acyl-CoA thioesterase [Rhodococcus sp. NPDC003318]|uniref:acyl-CoA thioesterase n=1 Tax=Rhodococcus sp. NPDC003318 TaxID=3364503 RepID=UPI0036A1CF12